MSVEMFLSVLLVCGSAIAIVLTALVVYLAVFVAVGASRAKPRKKNPVDPKN